MSMHRLAQSISPTLQAVFGTLRASLAAIGFSASRGPCLSLASPSTSRKAFSSLSPAFVSPLTALFTFVETTRVLYSLRSFFRVAIRITAIAHLCTHFANRFHETINNPHVLHDTTRETIATTVLLQSRCSSELPPLLPSWPAPPASAPSPSLTAWP